MTYRARFEAPVPYAPTREFRSMPPRLFVRLESALRAIRSLLAGGRAHRSAGAAWFVIASAMLALGACSKPVSFQALDTDFNAPLEGVRIHRHSVSIFSLLPSKRAPLETDFAGDAIVPVPPNPTALTFLRQGYEPVSIAVFRQIPSSLRRSSAGSSAAQSPATRSTATAAHDSAPGAAASPSTVPLAGDPQACDIPPFDDEDPCAAWQRILLWDDLMPKIPVAVRMRPLRTAPVDVLVVDELGAPIAGCEVFGTTFLFLPLPGAEPDWGFPSLQREVTDSFGRATLVSWSGFRNRITARMEGRGEAHAEIEGAQSLSVRLVPREVQWRRQRIRVTDQKRRPVPGATVSYGTIRNGLPVGPDAFIVETDRDGQTPEIELPDDDPLLLKVKAKGFKDRMSAPPWRTLEQGGIWRVVLEKR